MTYGSRNSAGGLLRQVLVRKFILVIASFCLLVAPSVWAQQEQEASVAAESVRDMYIVAGTTAVGAILGLSTLSFVEEPARHLKNVVVGGALGIIVGVGVVAYLQANKSRELYLEGGGEGAPAGAFIPKTEEFSPTANAVEYYEKKSGSKKTPFFTFSYTF